MNKSKMHIGVWVLAIAAFAIGIAEFIVVGILPTIAHEFNISIAQTGRLVGFYAFALAIGTPIVILSTANISRKRLLLTLIATFLIGNLISATAQSFSILLAGRIITAIAHGSFFAIGATYAARLAPEGHAGRAIALMFSGLTLAMVVGVPLGSLLGNLLSWRLPFYAVVLLALLSLLAMSVWIPKLNLEKTSTLSEQLQAIQSKPVLLMMSITILGFGASFAAFTFITPILINITGFSSSTANLLLIVFGVATLCGNTLGGSFSVQYGWGKTLKGIFVCLFFILIALFFFIENKITMTVLLFIWGMMAFGMSPALQSGMIATSEKWTPKAVDFASALNISGFNLGIALGERLGSILVEQQQMNFTPLVGCALLILVQIPMIYLMKIKSDSQSI